MALAFLPAYDASNMRSWISLGGSITSSAPPMANNPWPGGFFSFMFFVPMYFCYILSGYSLYAAVVTLKIILFFFTLLTAFLLYQITKKVKPSYAEAVLIFTLLNPAILFINYIWAQVDILPVFFFTLGYTLIRYVDFGKSTLKRYLVGFFPIIISAFIYRYSLILIPAIIWYDAAGLRQKFSGVLVALSEIGALFAVEFVFFRGGLYNYAGALAGSVINNSAVEGLQYWITFPQLPYFVFLGILGIVVPVLLKKLKYIEPAALFFILLLFIYASAVPLPDYFLWLYPIGVFLAITSFSHLSAYKKLLLVNLPAYVGLFFINIVIGNPVQAGPFYFLFPILHENVVFLHTIQEYREWALIFNLFLIGSVILTSLFCLARSNSQRPLGSEGENVKLDRWKFRVTRRIKMVLAVAILLGILGIFAFNQVYSQPIVVSGKQNFPLELFPSYNGFDVAPMPGTYKLLNNNSVAFDNKSQPIGFLHPLNLQNMNISVDFNVQTNGFGYYGLLKTNNMLTGMEVEPNLMLTNWVSIEPIWFSNTIPEIQSIFSRNVTLYETALTSYILYNFDNETLGKYYVVCFKLTNNTSNHNFLFSFRNETGLSFEYAFSSTAATISYRNWKGGPWTYVSTDYTDLSSDSWNILVFEPTATGFYSWINNEPLHLLGDYFSEGTFLTITAPFYSDNNNGFHGYVTQLFSDVSPPRVQTERFFFFDNGSGNRSEMPLNSSEFKIALSTTSNSSRVQVANYTYTSSIPGFMIFGKLTAGDYGLTLTLDYMVIAQKTAGFYFTAIYFAVIVPFFVAASTLPLLYNKRNMHNNSSEKSSSRAT